MNQVTWKEIDGTGKMHIITITGNASRNCTACVSTFNGGAVGCTLHNVTRDDKEI